MSRVCRLTFKSASVLFLRHAYVIVDEKKRLRWRVSTRRDCAKWLHEGDKITQRRTLKWFLLHPRSPSIPPPPGSWVWAPPPADACQQAVIWAGPLSFTPFLPPPSCGWFPVHRIDGSRVVCCALYHAGSRVRWDKMLIWGRMARACRLLRRKDAVLFPGVNMGP